MKVLKAWRRTMLSILASMACLPLAMSSTSVFAQDAGAYPGVERGADGLGYYAAGYEPDAAYGGGGGGGYPQGDAGCPTEGEMFMDDMDAECRHFGGHFRNLLCMLAPYTAGGRCAPRWYDVNVDFLYIDRDVSNTTVTYLADGLNAVGGPALGTQNLTFDYEVVPRITFAGQVGPAGLVEFSYLGLGNWASQSTVTSNGDLFSPFSQFGLVPAFGFDETDQASFGSLAPPSIATNSTSAADGRDQPACSMALICWAFATSVWKSKRLSMSSVGTARSTTSLGPPTHLRVSKLAETSICVRFQASPPAAKSRLVFTEMPQIRSLPSLLPLGASRPPQTKLREQTQPPSLGKPA
jgi:hypothetical protein